MDPQREFIRYNSKVTECSFIRVNEKSDMEDFRKPIKCFTICIDYKYKKSYVKIFCLEHNQMGNLWRISN